MHQHIRNEWMCFVIFHNTSFLFVVNANCHCFASSSVDFCCCFSYLLFNYNAVFCMFSGCDSECAWKSKYTKNFAVQWKYTHKKANTCNWMLMSTEYSLLSGKETSRCFYSVAWCIYTLLFPLFGQFVLCMCRNDASPSSQLQQQRQQICFTYKFIFFALFSLLETPEITTAVFFRGNNMKHGGCQYIVDKVNETGEVGCC